MKNVKTLLIVIGSLFVAFVIGWLSLFNRIQTQSSPEEPSRTIAVPSTIDLSIDYGDGNKITYNTQATEGTVYNLLKMIAIDNNIELDTESYDFGVFVKSIDEFESTAEKSWIYFVNGESGTVAADRYILESGDVVEWRYIKPE